MLLLKTVYRKKVEDSPRNWEKWVSWHVTHRLRSIRIWILDIAHTTSLFLHAPQPLMSLAVTWRSRHQWPSNVSEQFGQLTIASLQLRYSLPSPLRSARIIRVSEATSPWAKENKSDLSTHVQHF